MLEHIAKMKNAYMIVVGKSERTTPLWGSWGDDIVGLKSCVSVWTGLV
jgi:hypothetical protein